MLSFLDQYGLPVKYAVFGLIGGLVGAFLADAVGIIPGGAQYLSIAVGGAIGGYFSGRIKENKGKSG